MGQPLVCSHMGTASPQSGENGKRWRREKSLFGISQYAFFHVKTSRGTLESAKRAPLLPNDGEPSLNVSQTRVPQCGRTQWPQKWMQLSSNHRLVGLQDVRLHTLREEVGIHREDLPATGPSECTTDFWKVMDAWDEPKGTTVLHWRVK